jgi:hypothetical protein
MSFRSVLASSAIYDDATAKDVLLDDPLEPLIGIRRRRTA